MDGWGLVFMQPDRETYFSLQNNIMFNITFCHPFLPDSLKLNIQIIPN